MQENNEPRMDVTDLENTSQPCDNTRITEDELVPKGLVGILLRIGRNQERIIAAMKKALEEGRQGDVVELAKELVYGKS